MVHFFFTGKLNIKDSAQAVNFKSNLANSSSDEDKEKQVTNFLILRTGQVWILADKRGVRHLMNTAVNELYRLSLQPKPCFPRSHVDHLLQQTTAQSKLQLFLVDLFIGRSKFSDLPDDYGLPPQFYVAVLRRMCEQSVMASDDERKTSRFRYWRGVDLCRFHDHEKGEKCEMQWR